MEILESHINRNRFLPEEKHHLGYVNCVLAIRKDDQYDASNTYIPKWEVVNVAYYRANSKNYDGWIELEHVLPAKDIL